MKGKFAMSPKRIRRERKGDAFEESPRKEERRENAAGGEGARRGRGRDAETRRGGEDAATGKGKTVVIMTVVIIVIVMIIIAVIINMK